MVYMACIYGLYIWNRIGYWQSFGSLARRRAAGAPAGRPAVHSLDFPSISMIVIDFINLFPGVSSFIYFISRIFLSQLCYFQYVPHLFILLPGFSVLLAQRFTHSHPSILFHPFHIIVIHFLAFFIHSPYISIYISYEFL